MAHSPSNFVFSLAPPPSCLSSHPSSSPLTLLTSPSSLTCHPSTLLNHPSSLTFHPTHLLPNPSSTLIPSHLSMPHPPPSFPCPSFAPPPSSQTPLYSPLLPHSASILLHLSSLTPPHSPLLPHPTPHLSSFTTQSSSPPLLRHYISSPSSPLPHLLPPSPLPLLGRRGYGGGGE